MNSNANKLQRCLILAMLIMLACPAIVPASATSIQEAIFTPVYSDNGMYNNSIRAMTGLPDGRMFFVTVSELDIYDGASHKVFEAFPADKSIGLDTYYGYHRIYLDSDTLLWIKNYRTLSCFDLRNECIVPPPSQHSSRADDFFIDNHGGHWWLVSDTLRGDRYDIPVTKTDGILQDMASAGGYLYLFFNTGRMVACDIDSGRRLYHSDAYSPERHDDFCHTSLVHTDGSYLYQLRNGKKGGFFRYDTLARKWEMLLETPYTLNTLLISHDGNAFITCTKGMWIVDLYSGNGTYAETLRTVNGETITTEISTVHQDRNGGLWLGTYNRGLFYSHPAMYQRKCLTLPHSIGTVSNFIEDKDGKVYLNTASGKYLVATTDGSVFPADRPISTCTVSKSGNSFVAYNGTIYFNGAGNINIYTPSGSIAQLPPVTPVKTAIHIHGEPLEQLPGMAAKSGFRAPAAINMLHLDHDENYLSFSYSVLDYCAVDSSTLRYMLEGFDRHTMTVTTPPYNKGVFQISYTNLPPGEYTLVVESLNSAGEASEPASLGIIISPPWWKSGTAYCIYALVGVALLAALAWVYTTVTRRRLQRKLKEEMLLTRIRDLIKQCELYETERETPCDAKKKPDTAEPDLSEADRLFIAKAVDLVESNLNAPGYSVEQLSRDLCMDRTGLYRKLVALLDQSPSLFIRNIRLRNAAALLSSHPEMSVSQVAELTGFSSSSYLSKCFQEMYGCRPSEYAGKST